MHVLPVVFDLHLVLTFFLVQLEDDAGSEGIRSGCAVHGFGGPVEEQLLHALSRAEVQSHTQGEEVVVVDEEVSPLEGVVLAFLDPTLEHAQHLDELESAVDDSEVSRQSEQVEPIVEEPKLLKVSLAELFRQGHAQPTPRQSHYLQALAPCGAGQFRLLCPRCTSRGGAGCAPANPDS